MSQQRKNYPPVIIKQFKPAKQLSERRILTGLVSVEVKHRLDCPHGYGPCVIYALNASLPGALEQVLQRNGVFPADTGVHPD